MDEAQLPEWTTLVVAGLIVSAIAYGIMRLSGGAWRDHDVDRLVREGFALPASDAPAVRDRWRRRWNGRCLGYALGAPAYLLVIGGASPALLGVALAAFALLPVLGAAAPSAGALLWGILDGVRDYPDAYLPLAAVVGAVLAAVVVACLSFEWRNSTFGWFRGHAGARLGLTPAEVAP